ncbi:MAG: RNA methyltransferase [Phormidesmis sp.]
MSHLPQPSTAEALAAIRIVLVSPAGPLNVGSIARVMKNFGFSQLVLVAPQCDPLDADALQMAVHADDVLRAANLVNTIPEALASCKHAIATTARNRGFDAPLLPPETALPKLFFQARTAAASTGSSQLKVASDADEPTGSAFSPTALIFGPEDRGLSNEELTYAQTFTKIQTTDAYSALNLAQAVTVCCYELSRAAQKLFAERSSVTSTHDDPLQNSPSSVKQTESNHLNLATLDDLEGYYQHLEAVLLKVEYLYPHTAASRMRKFRQLLHRTTPTANEVALLRGMLRQVEWALSDSTKG